MLCKRISVTAVSCKLRITEAVHVEASRRAIHADGGWPAGKISTGEWRLLCAPHTGARHVCFLVDIR